VREGGRQGGREAGRQGGREGRGWGEESRVEPSGVLVVVMCGGDGGRGFRGRRAGVFFVEVVA